MTYKLVVVLENMSSRRVGEYDTLKEAQQVANACRDTFNCLETRVTELPNGSYVETLPNWNGRNRNDK